MAKSVQNHRRAEFAKSAKDPFELGKSWARMIWI